MAPISVTRTSTTVPDSAGTSQRVDGAHGAPAGYCTAAGPDRGNAPLNVAIASVEITPRTTAATATPVTSRARSRCVTAHPPLRSNSRRCRYSSSSISPRANRSARICSAAGRPDALEDGWW